MSNDADDGWVAKLGLVLVGLAVYLAMVAAMMTIGSLRAGQEQRGKVVMCKPQALDKRGKQR